MKKTLMAHGWLYYSDPTDISSAAHFIWCVWVIDCWATSKMGNISSITDRSKSSHQIWCKVSSIVLLRLVTAFILCCTVFKDSRWIERQRVYFWIIEVEDLIFIYIYLSLSLCRQLAKTQCLSSSLQYRVNLQCLWGSGIKCKTSYDALLLFQSNSGKAEMKCLQDCERNFQLV